MDLSDGKQRPQLDTAMRRERSSTEETRGEKRSAGETHGDMMTDSETKKTREERGEERTKMDVTTSSLQHPKAEDATKFKIQNRTNTATEGHLDKMEKTSPHEAVAGNKRKRDTRQLRSHQDEAVIQRKKMNKDRDFTEALDRPGGSSTPSACPGHRTSVSIERFTFQKMLGQGNFGRVLLAQDSLTKTYLAMKIIRKRELQDEDVRKAIRVERRILHEAAGNSFIIRGICAFQTEELLFLGMEFAHGGDLEQLLFDVGHLDIEAATFYAAEMTSGIQFLHRKGFIHRDIKPENILIDGAGHIKVADFGLALENMDGAKKAKGIAGTPGYLAPEMRHGSKYNFAVDWFSFGVVLFQLLTGEYPAQVRLLHVMDFSLDRRAKNIIEKLLIENPARRLGADGNVRYHPFFRRIDWMKLESLQLEPPFIPGKPSEESLPHPTLEQLLSPAGSALNFSSCHQEEFCGFSF